jgi:hypothetical protein
MRASTRTRVRRFRDSAWLYRRQEGRPELIGWSFDEGVRKRETRRGTLRPMPQRREELERVVQTERFADVRA